MEPTMSVPSPTRTGEEDRCVLLITPREATMSQPTHEKLDEAFIARQRERLLARTNNCREKSAFLVGCGAAGISVSSRTGVSLSGERPIAP